MLQLELGETYGFKTVEELNKQIQACLDLGMEEVEIERLLLKMRRGGMFEKRGTDKQFRRLSNRTSR